MSFLKEPNRHYRLFLQLKGFLSNTYVEEVGKMLHIQNFRLPNIEITESDILHLEMPENLRLGNRLERFFSFLIQESKNYELLVENIQINENKRTLGELDFIIFNKEKNEFIHIELGGKVYLYDETIEEELARWVGPNRRDSLLNKTKKLHEKQFPLLYHKSTIDILKEKNIDVSLLTQKVCFKARLFLPDSSIESIPPFVSKDNIKGYYLTITAFYKLKEHPYSYFIPKKQDWIVDPKYGEVWYHFSEVIQSIKDSLQKKQSPLVWVKKAEKKYETLIVVWW